MTCILLFFYRRYIWGNRKERPNVGGASTRSRNGARSRKGCAVNDPMSEARNK